ncbi:MAG: DinB family protein [Anaerolineales bacterium]
MAHTLVTQLRFARSEFVRCLEGVSDEDARHRIMPMNCISWMVGHMAAQEQYYFVFFPQGKVLHPQLNKLVGFGQPATTPPLADMWQVWHDITAAADTFLDTLTTEQLLVHLEQDIKAFEDSLFGTATKQMLAQNSVRSGENVGTRMQRTTYHYFFHTGEAHAVRQQLGHPDLPYFVGDMPDFDGDEN